MKKTPTIVPLQVTAAPTKNWGFSNIWLIWVRKRETPKASQQSKQTWTGKRWLLQTQSHRLQVQKNMEANSPVDETDRKAMGKKNMKFTKEAIQKVTCEKTLHLKRSER